MGSTLPVYFMTWTNHLSWILTMEIVAETKAFRFFSNGNRDSNKWYQSDRSQVWNSPSSRWGGYCWTLGSKLPMCFATWTNYLSWILTLAIVAETKSYTFWSNNNRDSNKHLPFQIGDIAITISVPLPRHLPHCKSHYTVFVVFLLTITALTLRYCDYDFSYRISHFHPPSHFSNHSAPKKL